MFQVFPGNVMNITLPIKVSRFGLAPAAFKGGIVQAGAQASAVGQNPIISAINRAI
jgi:hypothetical protein